MKRSSFLIASLILFLNFFHSSWVYSEDEELTLSRITGQVNELPEKTTAVVFLCDAKTGLPVERENPGEVQNPPDWNRYHHALTGQNGRFEIRDVRPGTYRLFAQSWEGLQGLPESLIARTEDEFTIHGTVEKVVVPRKDTADGTVEVIIEPLGNETIEVFPTPKEGSAFLLISRGKTLGHPAMGYVGWGDEFLSNLCLFTFMKRPHVIVHGLPEDDTMILSTQYNDNAGGAGGTEFKASEKIVKFYVVASWSNGHKKPPQYLKELTDAFATDAELLSSIPDLIGFTRREMGQTIQKRRAPQKMWDSLGGAKRIVNVPGVGKYRVIDIVSAEGYVRLKK